MTWAKIDDRLCFHPKAFAAGFEAMGFWTLCLSYCAAYGTDGHVTRHVTLAVTRGDAASADRLAARLVAAGLWEVTADGWRFHDYLDHNDKAETVARRRKLHADRQSRYRERQLAEQEARQQTPKGSSHRDASRDGTPSRPVPSQYLEPPNPPTGGEGVQAAAGQAEPPAAKAPKGRRREQEATDAEPAIREVFDYWRVQTGHPQATLTQARASKIRARLAERGCTPAKLKQAVDGNLRSDFHQGRKPGHPAKHDSIELICRDQTHVDMFVNLASRPVTNGESRALRVVGRPAELDTPIVEGGWHVQ